MLSSILNEGFGSLFLREPKVKINQYFPMYFFYLVKLKFTFFTPVFYLVHSLIFYFAYLFYVAYIFYLAYILPSSCIDSGKKGKIDGGLFLL